MTDPDKAVAVAHLRAKVGAGIRDCKIVLEACNYDEAIAVEILRRKGLAVCWRRQEPHTNTCGYVSVNGVKYLCTCGAS